MTATIDEKSPLAPNAQFNALSESEKKRVLSGSFGNALLQSGLQFAIPLWWLFEDESKDWSLRCGSSFLIDLGQGIFGVTAAHVLKEYAAAKEKSGAIGCQLGNVLIDPEARLVDCRIDLDIATFAVRPEEAMSIGKATVTAGPPHWAPLVPAVGNFAFFAGFPAQTRGMTPTGSFLATAPYFAMPHITSVTDHQISCRFDREKSVDLSGNGLPPVGYDIGGVSGGPMLMPTLVREGGIEGVVWRFAGVVTEAARGDFFEQVVAVRAHYIHPDGRLG